MSNARQSKYGPFHTCPGQQAPRVRELLTLLGDKWSIFTAMSLSRIPGRRARFRELERFIPGITQRVLTVTLRNLERDGFVSRHVFPEVPPRVEYELTRLGESLLEMLPTLVNWVDANWDGITSARADFDRQVNAPRP